MPPVDDGTGDAGETDRVRAEVAEPPERVTVPESGAESAAAAQPDAQRARRRRRRWRLIGGTVSIGIGVAIFAFALPRIASYSGVFHTVAALSAGGLAFVAATAAFNLLANWMLITASLPGLTLSQAGQANLASTAVANTVPGGGAIAMGVTWSMLSSWGFGTGPFALSALVTGVWSLLAKVGTPVFALVVLAVSGGAQSGLVTAAVIGAAVFAGAVTVLALTLHSEAFAETCGRVAQRIVNRVFRLIRRKPPTRVAGAVVDFRHRARELVRVRGRRLTITTIISDVAWWFVLIACLRACGVTAGEVSWQRSFAAFALTRLISSVPITPGGLGVIELGLTGYLASGLNAAGADKVGAAVLLTRAATYLLPIPLGAVVYARWRATRRSVGGAL